jgi:hypothetical protein
MAVSWVAGTSVVDTTATSLAATSPAGVTTGDTLLAAVFAGSAITPPAGWTSIQETSVFTDGALNRRVAVFSKDSVTGSDASTSFTWTQASSSRISVVYACARGVDSQTDTSNILSSQTDLYAITPSALTADDEGQMLIAFAGTVQGGTGSAPTPPSSFTHFSGSVSPRWLAGAYRLVNTGQSNSGAYNLFPAFVIDEELPSSNGLGAITVLLKAPAASAFTGLISVASPLGAPEVLGRLVAAARVSVAGPLGSPAVVGFHDFADALAGLKSLYVMDLTTPSGAVRVPISSWQATLQVDAQNYLQAVVPACEPYLTAINAATAFSVLRRSTLADGFVMEYAMASSPVDFVSIAQGTQNYTATISGYSPAFTADEDPPARYDRTLTGIRAVFSQASGIRVRCDLDWLLRPAQRAFYGDAPFVASYVNYYVADNDAYMDVGERVAPA